MAQILTLTLVRYCKFLRSTWLLKVITGSCLSLRCLIFKVLRRLSWTSVLSLRLIYHITLSSFCQEFFETFLKSFFGQSVSFKSAHCPENRCSSWFQALLFCSLVRQLCYHTTYFPICQHLFSNFFLLLQIVYFSAGNTCIWLLFPSLIMYSLYNLIQYHIIRW